MNRRFVLVNKFGDTDIPVKDICERYFGCSIKTANERIKANKFPIPAYRMHGKNSGDFFVAVDDLCDLIDSQHAKAKEDWEKVNASASKHH